MAGGIYRRESYERIPIDEKSEAEFSAVSTKLVKRTTWTVIHITSLLAVAIIGLTTGIVCGALSFGSLQINPVAQHFRTCTEPTLRREWRSLDRAEKENYITAVKCLKTISSQLSLNQTLYDDFPWVHKRFSEYCMISYPLLSSIRLLGC